MPEDAGALLVRSGLIAEEELTSALATQAQRGGTVGEYLVLAGVIDDDRLAEFFRTHLMIPQVSLRQLLHISKDIIQRIPADMATEHRCIPVAYDRDGNLTVAMAEPSNTGVVDELGFFTSCYVIRVVATQSQIAWALAHYYGRLTELGQRLLDDPDGALIPGPMPPRRSLTPEHPSTPPSTLDNESTDHSPARRQRGETNSETTGGNISGEFIVTDSVVEQRAVPQASMDAAVESSVVDKTARLPSSPPAPDIAGEPERAQPRRSERADPPAPDQPPVQRRKLPLPADLPDPSELPKTNSGPIPVIIDDDDSPPTYRPRPTGRLGKPQRHISFFQDDTPPTREIQALPPEPAPSNDPELVPRFGEVSVRSQPIRVVEKSLPAVLVEIDDPLADDPLADDPLVDDPLADDPLADDPLADDPLADDPLADDPPQAPPAASPAQSPSQARSGAERSPTSLEPTPATPPLERPTTVPAEVVPAEVVPAEVVDDARDIGTAPTIPPPVAGKRPPRRRTRTFQGLGIGNAPPLIPEDDPIAPPGHDDNPPAAVPAAVPSEPRADEHGADRTEPVPHLATDPAGAPVESDPEADVADPHDKQFDDFPDDFDSGNWNEIFSNGAPVRAPDMPTLRVNVPPGISVAPLRAWQNTDGSADSVINSIQKAAEAAAEAHARTHRDTDVYDTHVDAATDAATNAATDATIDATIDPDGERTATTATQPDPEQPAPEQPSPDPDDDDSVTGEYSGAADRAPDVDDDDDDDDHYHGHEGYDPTHEMDAAELPEGVDLTDDLRSPDDAAPAPDGPRPGTITGEPTSRVERPPVSVMDHGANPDDEQWGPPGTTIPPPFLGAVSYDDTGNVTGIPLITDDLDEDISDVVDVPLPSAPPPADSLPSDGTVAPILNPGSGRHERAESVVQAPLSLYDSEDVTPQVLREFENSQESLAEPLRHLQLANTRDAVIQIMINHMTEAHENVAFFVVKGERLEPFRVIGGTDPAINDPNRLSKIWLRIDFPSTFQDIVATRLPYRGPITDQASRDLVHKTFGAVGETMLGLPLTIRERVVGVLYGDSNTRHVFVQNLGVLVRAAGGALERIIRNARNQPG